MKRAALRIVVNRLRRKNFLIKLAHWLMSGQAGGWLWGHLVRGEVIFKNLLARSGTFKIVCPVCGWKGAEFYPIVSLWTSRRNEICPGCGSLERYRQLVKYIDDHEMVKKGMMCLDIGPWEGMKQCIGNRGAAYLSVDLGEIPADIRMDVRTLAFRDQSIDLIFCFHVLEFVDDWGYAVDELFRILRQGGCLVLSENYMAVEETVRSDVNKVISGTPLLRFGNDLPRRLAKAGFSVEPYDYLKRNDWFFICRKEIPSGECGNCFRGVGSSIK